MVDRAGDLQFSLSEKAKLKRFVALILARAIAKRKRQAKSVTPTRANSKNPRAAGVAGMKKEDDEDFEFNPRR